jgi:predicted dehydrogenase
VRVVAIADPDSASLAAARQLAPHADALSDHRDLYDRPDVDAVVVCLPSALHAEAGLTALAAGKGLYLEKPIAAGLDQAREVVAAGRQAARPAMVGFNYRFHPLVDALRRRIAAGELGECRAWRSIFTVRAHPTPAWKEALRTGGGVLLDFASHHVDLLRFVTGREVRDVFATARSSNAREEDSAAMQLVLDDGVMAQIFCSWSATEEDRLEVSGTAGSLLVDRHRSLGVERRGPRAPLTAAGLLAAMAPAFDAGYARERLAAPRREPSYARALAYFAACVRRAEAAAPGLEDGLRSLAVVVAARESVRDGRCVRVGA